MSHRKALLKHLAVALFRHDAIETGLMKAKELRMFAEPLITLAKQDSVANRRRAFSKLRDDEVVTKLFTTIGPAFAERPGGYTRIMRLGNRVNDACPMARIELVGLGEHKVEK
jgi:large subunit ribosomal protein L17